MAIRVVARTILWVAGAKRSVPRSQPGHGLAAFAPATPTHDFEPDRSREPRSVRAELSAPAPIAGITAISRG